MSRIKCFHLPATMHVRFWILAVVVVTSGSLPLEGAYRLVFESKGEEHTVEGVEKSKPYYREDGERRFLHAAGRVNVKPGPDASPLDFLYPAYYTIEKIEGIHERLEGQSRFRVSFNLFRSQVGYERNFDPRRLLTHWRRENIQEGILTLIWVSSGNLRLLDMAQLVEIEKPARFRDMTKKVEIEEPRWEYKIMSGEFPSEFPNGYPALGLFVGGESFPPRYPAENEHVVSSIIAACRGKVESIKETVQLEKVLTYKDVEGNTLLHFAASNGHPEIVKILLESGIKPNLRNAQGATPLILAAERGRTACVEALLSVAGRIGLADDNDGNALHYAIRFGHEEVASRLLQARIGANKFGLDRYHPIAIALNFNRGRILEKLVSSKGRWDSDTEVLNRLLVGKSGIGKKRLVRYLISRGGRADKLASGTTALIAATGYADEEMLEMLLEAGADVNQTNERGISPLMRASLWANEVAVRWLLKHGADVNHTTPSGNSALSMASFYHHAEVVRLLLEHGADPNLADGKGFTPLESATLHGDRSIVQDLLEAGAECELTEEKALLLMNYAFRNNIPEFVEIALSDCLTKDFLFHDRFSPAWVAEYYGHDEITELFGGGTIRDVEAGDAGPSLTPSSKVRRRPRLLEGKDVPYPQELAEKYGDQTVRVRFLIAEDGSALFPKVVSGDIPVVNQLAMNAVGRWKHEPPRARGKPVLTQYVADIRFVRRDPEEFVFDVSEVDQDPKRIVAVRPVYPLNLKMREIEGWVLLFVVIDDKGNVVKAQGWRYSHPDFVRPAIEAVLKWKFEPGYKDGRPVKVRRIQPISFKLN